MNRPVEQSGQRRHLRRECQEHPACPGLHEWREADELDRVADTLFRMQQDGSACQRFAVPPREFGRAIVNPGEIHTEPPFVFGPASLEVSLPQERYPQVEVGGRQPGIEPDGLAKLRGSLLESTEAIQDEAVIGADPGLIRLMLTSDPVAIERPLQIPPVGRQPTEPGMRRATSRSPLTRDRDDSAEAGFGLGQTTVLEERLAISQDTIDIRRLGASHARSDHAGALAVPKEASGRLRLVLPAHDWPPFRGRWPCSFDPGSEPSTSFAIASKASQAVPSRSQASARTSRAIRRSLTAEKWPDRARQNTVRPESEIPLSPSIPRRAGGLDLHDPNSAIVSEKAAPRSCIRSILAPCVAQPFSIQSNRRFQSQQVNR